MDGVDPFSMTDAELSEAVEQAAHRLDIVRLLSGSNDSDIHSNTVNTVNSNTDTTVNSNAIAVGRLRVFVEEVRGRYSRRNAYHGWGHAVDVLLAACAMLHPPVGLIALSSREDRLVLFIAALCHDAGHPGRSNGFLANARAHLCRLFPMTPSVLEAYACSITRALVRKHRLLDALPPPQQDRILARIDQAILHTDMRHHFPLLARFTRAINRYEKLQSSSTIPDDADDDDLSACFVEMLLHTADISNPCRPWPLAKSWSDRIMEEFAIQSDTEQRLRLPITPNMNRDDVNQPRIAIEFANTIVKPMLKLWTRLSPAVERYIDELDNGCRQWEKMLQLSSELAAVSLSSDDKPRRFSVAAGTVVLPSSSNESSPNISTNRKAVSPASRRHNRPTTVHASHAILSQYRRSRRHRSKTIVPSTIIQSLPTSPNESRLTHTQPHVNTDPNHLLPSPLDLTPSLSPRSPITSKSPLSPRSGSSSPPSSDSDDEFDDFASHLLFLPRSTFVPERPLNCALAAVSMSTSALLKQSVPILPNLITTITRTGYRVGASGRGGSLKVEEKSGSDEVTYLASTGVLFC